MSSSAGALEVLRDAEGGQQGPQSGHAAATCASRATAPGDRRRITGARLDRGGDAPIGHLPAMADDHARSDLGGDATRLGAPGADDGGDARGNQRQGGVQGHGTDGREAMARSHHLTAGATVAYHEPDPAHPTHSRHDRPSGTPRSGSVGNPKHGLKVILTTDLRKASQHPAAALAGARVRSQQASRRQTFRVQVTDLGRPSLR